MEKEFSNEDFYEWMEDYNAYGDLDRDYYGYVDVYMENEDPAEEMLTFQEFARNKYEEFLHDIHKDDDLDDENEPYPYANQEKDEN